MNLQLGDIQGNVLAGFNTNVEVFIGLTADRQRIKEAARWLANLAPEVTTVEDIARERSEIKAPLRGGSTAVTWLCVAIGPELMGLLRPDVIFHDEAFVRGFIKRSRGALGDRTDPAGWRVGDPKKPLDVLLIIAANDEETASARCDALIAGTEAVGLTCNYRETARRIRDLEHFGFRDGISQPRVRGLFAEDGMPPGHFVFGYERFPGEPTFTPATDPKGFLKNGSFLVYRRLGQDVAKFRAFCARKATELQSTLPGMTSEHLAALLVGRWPGGALATLEVTADPGPVPDEDKFDFSSPTTCPFGSHIRKVNPRAGPKDIVDVPRILRRGIPFGPPFDADPSAERGLAFVSFQTSIREQLELLTGGWMNSPSRPATRAGHDLLVGRAIGPRTMILPVGGTDIFISDDGVQWINPTGGGYLFAPGRASLSRLTEDIAPGLRLRAERFYQRARTLLPF